MGLYRDNGKENGSYYLGFRVSQIRGTSLRGPNNKDYSFLGSILGSPYFGKLPRPSTSVLLSDTRAQAACLEHTCHSCFLAACVVAKPRHVLRLQNDGRSVQQRDAYTDPGPQERHICPGAVSSKTSPEPVAFWYGMLLLDSGQEIKDMWMTARYKQMQNVVELSACFMKIYENDCSTAVSDLLLLAHVLAAC